MIRMLSDVGRAMVVVSSLLVIALATAAGYYYAAAGSFFRPSGTEPFYPILGLGIGVVLAGAIFGPLATLYDIRDNLRRLAPTSSDDRFSATPERREPRLD
jgi:hypothetical protein